MSYVQIVNFGPSVEKCPQNNPLTYCMTSDLDNSFLHTAGQKWGPYSKPCQMFMSDYCAQNWNGVCEAASANSNAQLPDTAMPWTCERSGQGACIGTGIGNQFTQGEILVRNTAAKKYLSQMSSNCCLKYESFDPMVPTSPMISYWEATCDKRDGCIPVYEVDPTKIDNDPVMNKLLSKPALGIDILLNIYNSARRLGKYEGLKNTKLYRFFQTDMFQRYARAKQHVAELKAGQ